MCTVHLVTAGLPSMTGAKTSARTATVRGSQSIDRAMQLLRHVAAHHAQGIELAALVEATQLDRTTTYRIATSLVRAGLVGRDGTTGLYRLGIEAMALGL